MEDRHAATGALLRQLRRTRHLTQAQLAAQAGCVLTTIKKIEAGMRRPSVTLARRLADVLELTGEERRRFLDQQAESVTADSAPAPNDASPAPSALIGRSRELAQLQALFDDTEYRIVTLTGPGGVGKTRLAFELVSRAASSFADGVRVVELASVGGAALVAGAIARTLGLEPGPEPVAALARVIGERDLLMLLDNFEHVLDAAPLVGALCAACPHLRVVVTSRVPLHLAGERLFDVAPLELPPLRHAHVFDTYPAVQLFLRRARAVQPDYAPSPDAAQAITAICRRLDGLPLAIELAAARIRLLPPVALLRRIDRGLPLLTSGPHDAPERHQTMRAALDWSFRLLHERERRLFARLGVFAGGARLEAIEAICCSDMSGDPLHALQSLVEHSLARQTPDSDGEPRMSMLETIRQYAAEQLLSSGEWGELKQRHAAFFLRLAEDAVSGMVSAEQVFWLDLVERDLTNMHAALNWLVEQQHAYDALRLAGALQWFWDRRGYLSEGRMLTAAALELPGGQDRSDAAVTRARGWALIGSGALAFDQGDWPACGMYVEAAVECFRAHPDRRGLATALLRLAFVRVAAHPAEAQACLDEGLQQAQLSGDSWTEGLAHFVITQAALFGRGDATTARAHVGLAETLLRRSGDQTLLAHTLTTRGLVELVTGDFAAARSALESGLEQVRALRDHRSVALMAATTADIARCQGDYQRAGELYGESLALYHELGNDAEIPAILHNQAYVALGQNDIVGAFQLFAESLRRQQARDNAAGIAEGLAGIAAVAADAGQSERAAMLFGAAHALREQHPAPIWPAERFEVERHRDRLQARCSAADFEQWFQAGAALSPEQTRSEVDAVGEVSRKHSQQTFGLTARERDVVALVAQGHSNRLIAETLVISERTVEHHVANILAKLDFRSRAQIVAWATQHAFTPWIAPS